MFRNKGAITAACISVNTFYGCKEIHFNPGFRKQMKAIGVRLVPLKLRVLLSISSSFLHCYTVSKMPRIFEILTCSTAGADQFARKYCSSEQVCFVKKLQSTSSQHAILADASSISQKKP